MNVLGQRAAHGRGFAIAWEGKHGADVIDVLEACLVRVQKSPKDVPRKVPAPQVEAAIESAIATLDRRHLDHEG